MINYCNVDGLRTRYLATGEGEPVVFLHGWGTNLESFRPIYAALGNQMRVIAVDFPGFGQTDYPPVPWAVEDYMNWLLSFLQLQKITSASFLGHSFGGRVGIKLAKSAPEMVNKLVLVDSAGVRQFDMNWRNRIFKWVSKWMKPFLSLAIKVWGQKFRWKFYEMIGSTDYLTAGRLKETYQRVINEDLEEFLPAIKAPTLLIWGEKDKATPLADGILMSKKISNSKLVIVKGAGHYPFVDNPAEVNQTLVTFLQPAEQ